MAFVDETYLYLYFYLQVSTPKTPYEFFFTSKSVIDPCQLVVLDLITLILRDAEYTLCSSLFSFIHPLTTSTLKGPYVFFV